MQPLKLSVMMPNYNHGRYIADALDAIVNQSFQPFEVIVCDDGSTDDSVQIIRRFAERYPFVRLIRNDTNLGVFPTLDKLLASVSGDYLYSAAADDKILPGFFEKSMKLLMQYPQAGICSTLSFIINEEGKRKGWVLNPVISTKSCFFSPDRVRDIFLKQGSWTFGITSIMRFDYISANGGYRPELYAFSDGFLNEMMALKY
jgi:glycosyltransferase involved in cell wall biosynthesis